MLVEGISHKCAFTDCYSLNEDELVINVKTNKSISKVVIVHADPYIFGCSGTDPWSGQPLELHIEKELSHELIWSVTLKPEFKRVQYYFEIYAGDELCYLFEDGVHDKDFMKKDNIIRHFYKFAWMNRADICTHPKWAEDIFWYQIFPDRFCKLDYEGNKQLNDWDDYKSLTRDSFYGGNLKGAMSKLEYLKDLGITGIYFTPLVTSTENHKYNISDYEHIDPDFGDNEYFRKLVEKAHSLGIKVMIDAVFNHSGRGFFAWQDVVKNGKNSKYYDWYFVKKDNFSFDGNTKDGRYYSFAFVDEMPKLDTSNPEVMDYFTKVCKDWIEMWNIDGIRFDVGNEISHAFIKKLHRELKAVKPDLFLLGEIWMDSTPYLLGDEYDSVMNYPFMQSLSNFFVDESLSSDDFMYMMNYCYSLYMKQVNQVVFNFLDSHDVDRAITRCGSYDKLIQQLSVLVTMPGSPCIYYGTEIALEGKNDPDIRRPMPWKDIENKVYDKTISTVKSLISLRKQHKACESQNITWHSEDGRFIKYEKHSADEVLKVYINAGNSPLDVTINNEQVLFSHLYDSSCLQKGGVIITKLL